jgi:hypothetical protein
MTIEQAIKKANEKYVCLQEGTFWIEHYNGIIVLNWLCLMDKYINYRKVENVARFLRKYTNEPIYSAVGLMKI